MTAKYVFFAISIILAARDSNANTKCTVYNFDYANNFDSGIQHVSNEKTTYYETFRRFKYNADIFSKLRPPDLVLGTHYISNKYSNNTSFAISKNQLQIVNGGRLQINYYKTRSSQTREKEQINKDCSVVLLNTNKRVSEMFDLSGNNGEWTLQEYITRTDVSIPVNILLICDNNNHVMVDSLRYIEHEGDLSNCNFHQSIDNQVRMEIQEAKINQVRIKRKSESSDTESDDVKSYDESPDSDSDSSKSGGRKSNVPSLEEESSDTQEKSEDLSIDDEPVHRPTISNINMDSKPLKEAPVYLSKPTPPSFSAVSSAVHHNYNNDDLSAETEHYTPVKSTISYQRYVLHTEIPTISDTRIPRFTQLVVTNKQYSHGLPGIKQLKEKFSKEHMTYLRFSLTGKHLYKQVMQRFFDWWAPWAIVISFFGLIAAVWIAMCCICFSLGRKKEPKKPVIRTLCYECQPFYSCEASGSDPRGSKPLDWFREKGAKFTKKARQAVYDYKTRAMPKVPNCTPDCV